MHTTLDANKPGKDDQLTQAGADAAATELDEITTALAQHHGPQHHGPVIRQLMCDTWPRKLR